MSRCFLKPTQKKQRAWKAQPGTLYELSQKIIQKSLGASQSPLNRTFNSTVFWGGRMKKQTAWKGSLVTSMIAELWD